MPLHESVAQKGRAYYCISCTGELWSSNSGRMVADGQEVNKLRYASVYSRNVGVAICSSYAKGLFTAHELN